MGGLVFTAFIIQAATGVAMTFYYVPDVSRALSAMILGVQHWQTDGLRDPCTDEWWVQEARARECGVTRPTDSAFTGRYLKEDPLVLLLLIQ
jgi:hypothetical protein